MERWAYYVFNDNVAGTWVELDLNLVALCYAQFDDAHVGDW